MNAVILNGGYPGQTSVDGYGRILEKALHDCGWDSETLVLRKMEIRSCIGCFGCWTETPGVCRIDDDARPLAQSLARSDLVVFLTPVTFGGYSSELKRGLDRCICLISPFFTRVHGETHHKPRYGRYPRLLGLGIQATRDDRSAAIFQTLVGRNAINIHAPMHAAGTVLENEDEDRADARIRYLLRELEVSE